MNLSWMALALGLMVAALPGFAAVRQAAKPLEPQPLVIAHRGASGYLPEETLEAYALAVEQGADVLELDLIATRDGQLIARHDPNLALSTDVASRPEFADRKTTRQVDGEQQTGWFASDFTLAEIKTLGAISTDPERPQQYNGKFRVISFDELIAFAKEKRRETGRDIAIYPETKNPSYHRALGLPLEEPLLRALKAAGWNHRRAPVFVQSFEPDSLKRLRRLGLRTRAVQLIDGSDYDLARGQVLLSPPFDRPYDWVLSGDSRLFSDMLSPRGLAEIRRYADGIGPWKPYLLPLKGELDAAGQPRDLNGDGKLDARDGHVLPASDLVARAHRAGLFVHVFTFRNEARRLAQDYAGDPQAELRQFFELGVDGVFADFPDTALQVREALKGRAAR